ncbi:MAG: KH domain-containing protein [Clostridia bacterium]|jgi:predicted RNA-binding protein YlqC (UPF0109 family)|nr:KH domain-containing protein [Clostridia bacterium]MCX4366523.1 KH domain-containing protein [Clostridia bacterium]
MQELVKYIVENLVDDPTKVEVTTEKDNDTVVININAEKEEIGKIIGKQGRIAKAIRTVVKAGGIKENVKYSVEINEK